MLTGMLEHIGTWEYAPAMFWPCLESFRRVCYMDIGLERNISDFFSTQFLERCVVYEHLFLLFLNYFSRD